MSDLPLYQCHKRVRAVKIAGIEYHRVPQDSDPETNEYVRIIPDTTDVNTFWVSQTYVRKHEPKPGGYYVVYEDGYASWSPAEAFESGYTRL